MGVGDQYYHHHGPSTWGLALHGVGMGVGLGLSLGCVWWLVRCHDKTAPRRKPFASRRRAEVRTDEGEAADNDEEVHDDGDGHGGHEGVPVHQTRKKKVVPPPSAPSKVAAGSSPLSQSTVSAG